MYLIGRKYVLVLLMLVIISTVFSGCGKKFWDYDCIWYSENPYVWMETRGHNATIKIDGEIRNAATGWEPTGLGINFYDIMIDNGTTDASIIWETDAEIKDGKLVLTITYDQVFDMTGQTIVLEQIVYE